MLCANPDQFFEYIPHLHVVDVFRGQIDLRERFDDFVEKIFLRHPGDVFVEPKAVDDVAHVRRELVDVAVEVRRELVRVIQQLFEIELGQIVEWPLRNFLEQTANNCLWLFLNGGIFFEYRRLRGFEQTVEPAKNRQRKNDFPILVPLVRAAE